MDANSRDGHQPLLWHIHSTTAAIYKHTFQAPIRLPPRPWPPQRHRHLTVSQQFVCPGVGEGLPLNRKRVYTLPTFQYNTARIGHSWEFQPPVDTFFSCAYRPGRVAACLFWFPILSHCHRQIHPLAWGIPVSVISAEAAAKAFFSVWVDRFDWPPQSQTTGAGNF